MLLMVFPKKCFEANAWFGAQKWCTIKAFYNKRGQDVYENYINGFSKKFFFCGSWAIFDPQNDATL